MSEPFLLWMVLGAALPVLAVTATAFAKAAVLLGVLRAGLGAPGALPLAVTTGLAVILTLFVMAPVGAQVQDAVGPEVPIGAADWAAAGERAWPPVERFLSQHTRAADQQAVRDAAAGLKRSVDAPEARILAFLISELGAAFQLGILLFLPFLVVHLLTANTLAVLGFSLLPPALVALPFKLLLFVAADGWGLFVRGFAKSYGA